MISPSRRFCFLLLALLLLAAAAGSWWWFRPSAIIDPPLPQGIEDAEVRQAIEQARQRVLNEPGSAAAWGYFGMVLEAQLYEAEADRCFAEASRLDPTDARWPYFRGLYALKYTPDSALPFLRLAVALSDSWPEHRSVLRLRLAEALLERNELAEAEQLFREEERHDPGNPRVALGLGLIAVARGEHDAAVKCLTTARSSPFARKKATVQLAILARSRGDRKTADNLDKEIAVLPNDPVAWPDPLVDQIVRLQVGIKNWEREVEQLESEGRCAEAAQAYLKRLQERPTPRYFLGAGLNLARVGDYDRALPLLRQAVRLEPENAQAHYTLALAMFTRAEKAWASSPGSAQVKEWFGEVVESSRKATEIKPDHAQAYLFWGLALKYLDRQAESIAPLRKGVACRPENRDLQLALGEALLEAGQVQEAKTYLENARRIDPRDPRPARAIERLNRKRD